MQVLDEVWMLVNIKTSEVIYLIEQSPSALWERVIEEELMGTGVSKELLRKQGYRAKKVAFCIR